MLHGSNTDVLSISTGQHIILSIRSEWISLWHDYNDPNRIVHIGCQPVMLSF